MIIKKHKQYAYAKNFLLVTDVEPKMLIVIKIVNVNKKYFNILE